MKTTTRILAVILGVIMLFKAQNAQSQKTQEQDELQIPEYKMGLKYLEEHNYRQAKTFFLQAAEKGNTMAMVNLGKIEIEINENEATGWEWYIKAAELGNTKAMGFIAYIYTSGNEVIAKDYDNAEKWYVKAAEKGDADAMLDLVDFYSYKRPSNISARMWNDKAKRKIKEVVERELNAAVKGDITAINQIAFRYQYGKGVEKDANQALQWYLKAAENGNSNAMRNIGYMYHRGYLTEDFAKAMEWYLKAADKGNPYAMRDIGFMYYEGKGVDFDLDKGKEWFRKASLKLAY